MSEALRTVAAAPYRVAKSVRNQRTGVADYIVHSDTEGHLAVCKNERRAEQIARAVNSHDDLVAALKALVDQYDRPHGFDCDVGWYGKQFDQARAALAKAVPHAEV